MSRKMAVFAATVLLVFALFGCSDSEANGSNDNTSEAASEITETTLNGDVVSLSDFSGQVVVVNFWGLWCPYCKNELPDFYTVSQEYPDVVFLMVNTSNTLGSEDEDEISEYLDDNGLAFDYILLNSSAAQDYGVRSFPSTFIIDEDGNIADSATGMLSASGLRNMLDGVIGD